MRRRTAQSQRGTVMWVAACALFAASTVLSGSAATEVGAGPAPRFFGRADQSLRQYRAFRRMHAYSESQRHEAWMNAWTELRDGRFSYTIVSENGSETIRGRVLRAMLAREEEAVNKGEAARADLTSENYEF